MCNLPADMSIADVLVDYYTVSLVGMMRNVSPRTKAKTSRRKMARRAKISKRKIEVTRAKERVLPLNKAKNNPS